jgi:phosphoglucosamine mutase
MRRLPQVLVNVRVTDKAAVAAAPSVADAVAAVEAELGDNGRVLLRPSGTEQLVRVMVEAPSHDLAESAAQRLAGVVSSAG